MRFMTATALVAIAAGTAMATPREAITFNNVNSNGLRDSLTNTVLTTTFAGGYSVGRVHLSGTLMSVNPATYASEAMITVIAPSGESFDLQPSVNETFTTEVFNNLEFVLDANIAAGGTSGVWTFRFFEGFDDTGVDAVWNNITITLDDGPAATDRFVESTDAGSSLATAAVAAGSGPLTIIRGNLNDDEDMYRIMVCDPATFSISTYQGTDIDTRLYIFSLDGRGVMFNDDIETNDIFSFQSRVSAPAGVTMGEYYIAVAPYDHTAEDVSNQRLWLAEPFETQRAPDGPGAANPLDHFSFTTGETGPYTIFLTGACFVTAGPTCGTSDFDGDGDSGTDQDIEAFFACLGGNCCATCFPGGSDFNGDGDSGTDQDIEAFFRVLAGGNC